MKGLPIGGPFLFVGDNQYAKINKRQERLAATILSFAGSDVL